jgi:endoglucanase
VKRILPFCFLLIVLALPAFAQERTAAFAMNARLGRGINMGNAFEAPSETAWGNPWKPEYFRIMAEMGFQHVRVPIQWESADRSLTVAPYTIYPAFLARIKEVVDEALAQKLIIIINMHHHNLLFDDPLGQKARFLAQWRQIAAHFKDYPEELIFEVLNEPHGNLSPALWNVFFAEALAEIRQTNPNRTVLMGTAEFGGLSGLNHLQPPSDDNIIVTPHYYSPFPFTHQGAEWVGPHADAWLGTKWLDMDAERETVINEFAAALAFSEKHQIPIHVGEFGAYSKADLDSRVRWTTFVARWLEEQKLSWAYWEFSAGFGIYNRTTGQVLQPLADALLRNPLPDPTKTEVRSLYQSNFSAGTDGWVFQVQSGLSASISPSSGKLRVAITTGGTQGWHLQLIKTNVALHQGKMYRLTIRAVASAERMFTFYAGRSSSPWTSYSGYSSASLTTQERTYTQTFTMTNPTDLQSRLVLDLGNSTVDLEILEIRLDEINTLLSSTGPKSLPAILYFPNPVQSVLALKNTGDYRQALLYDLTGKQLAVFELEGEEASVNLENYSQGLYLIKLIGKKQQMHQFKVMKL